MWSDIKEWLISWRESIQDQMETGSALRYGIVLLALYLLLVSAIGIYWSQEPELPEQSTDNAAQKVVGVVTTQTLISVAETLLDKSGGFTSNDLFPPGLLLDNMPHWEYGVLIQVRDLTRAMRESFSRSQSQSQEDVDLARAEPRLNFSNNSWIVPASESEYRSGIKHLYGYLDRLQDSAESNAQFYARADNLRYWLSTVESRLGSLSQRLTASVGQRRLNTDLANDVSARQATAAPSEMEIKTPWLEIDDVFYEARGASWALIHFLRAIEVDFADVLENKAALVSLRQIIRELEATQSPVYSPIILNGGGFGLFANHSLVMASYISRANAAIIDLRELLERG